MGYYDADVDPGSIDCKRCPPGFNCHRRNLTLGVLPLQKGFYRFADDVDNAVRCPDAAANCEAFQCADSNSGCRGGSDVASQCADGLRGVLCRKCDLRDGAAHTYYVPADKDAVAKCQDCETGALMGDTFVLVGTVLGIVFLIKWLRAMAKRGMLDSIGRKFMAKHWRDTLTHAWRMFNLPVKIKIMFAFFQVITKVDSVYEVDLPPEVKRILAVIGVFISFGVDVLAQLLQCLGWRGYRSLLIFWLIAPIVIVGIVVLINAVRLSAAGRLTGMRLLAHALPWTLRVLFIIYPIVTGVAFDAYPCYRLGADAGTTTSWLKVDVDVQCYTPEHEDIVTIARVALIIYPVGLLFVYGALLISARKDIPHGRSAPLCRALAFLHNEYEDSVFWWELVEMLRKFIIVGVMVVVANGNMLQLAIGTVLCGVFLFLQLCAAPYKEISDDYLAATTGFCTLMFFVCAMNYKYASFFDLSYTRETMTEEQLRIYDIYTPALSAMVLISIFASLVGTAFIGIVQVGTQASRHRRELRFAKARRLRYVANDEEVTPPRIDETAYHLFLSHTWAQGQSEMRIVKAKLREMMPDIQVFLDVDDLEFGAGHEYIERSYVILSFCTFKYFKSKACAREVVDTVLQGKPFVALLEPDQSEARGGLRQGQIRHLLTYERHPSDLDPEGVSWSAQWGFDEEIHSWGYNRSTPHGQEIVDAMFHSAPIEWNRFSAFQDVSMRLIAERILQYTPSTTAEAAVGALQAAVGAFNPFALAGAANGTVRARTRETVEKKAVYVQGEVSNERPKLTAPHAPKKFHLYCSPNCDGASALAIELIEELNIGLQWTSQLHQVDECEHMLLYLTARTWTRGPPSDRFAAEIRAAQRGGVHLLLVHEFPSAVADNGGRGACAFEEFWNEGWTPKDLLVGDANVYVEIATSLKGGAWRRAGLIMLAGKMHGGSKSAKTIAAAVPKVVNRTSTRSLVAKRSASSRPSDRCASSRSSDRDKRPLSSAASPSSSAGALTNRINSIDDDEDDDSSDGALFEDSPRHRGEHTVKKPPERDTIESLSALAVQRTSSLERLRHEHEPTIRELQAAAPATAGTALDRARAAKTTGKEAAEPASEIPVRPRPTIERQPRPSPSREKPAAAQDELKGSPEASFPLSTDAEPASKAPALNRARAAARGNGNSPARAGPRRNTFDL